MEKKKLDKRSKLKPFLKVVNYNHVMPTRCAPRLGLFFRAALCPRVHSHGRCSSTARANAGAGGAGAWAEEKWAGAGWEGKLERLAREWWLTRVLGCRRYSLTDMHDIKDVVKTDILTGENPDEKKEAAKAVRKAFMSRCGSLSTLQPNLLLCRDDARRRVSADSRRGRTSGSSQSCGFNSCNKHNTEKSSKALAWLGRATEREQAPAAERASRGCGRGD